jgi:putative transposase
MIITQSFRAVQSQDVLDACNLESGRIYTQTLVTHWRIYRKKGVWLSQYSAMRLNDFLGGETTLHAHSRDAAQEGFYKACKTTRTLKKQGNPDCRFPWKHKRYRTTIWKRTGLRVRDGLVTLARARGETAIRVVLPSWLHGLQVLEMRLVYNHKAKHYDWHVVVEDGREKPDAPRTNVVAVDLGEVHPAAACDREDAMVFSARELRACLQGRNKHLAELSTLQSRCMKGSRRWERLQRAKNTRKRIVKCQSRDILHKVSRAVINFAVEKHASTLAIGDVRDVADSVNKGHKVNQKIAQWPHGHLRQYLTYKAERAGITVQLVDEAYTSQTCPNTGCGHRHKAKGRVYRCPQCGFQGHRDGQVGASNLLSKALYGAPGHCLVPSVTYRHPYLTGKRSPVDTRHVASAKLEAAPL